jgi:hypothetical protein
MVTDNAACQGSDSTKSRRDRDKRLSQLDTSLKYEIDDDSDTGSNDDRHAGHCHNFAYSISLIITISGTSVNRI